MKPLFIYQCGPIDFWQGWMQFDYKRSEMGDEPDVVTIPIEVLNLFIEAFFHTARAEGSYWEGDIRGDNMYYSGLPPASPDDCTCDRYMIAWKQDNNGQTFVASPIALSGWENHLIYQPVQRKVVSIAK